MERFSKGKTLKAADGTPIVIDSYINEGTQGVVYKVTYRGEAKALKWYKPRALRDADAFYENLKGNVRRGAPDKAFLWPQAVTDRSEGSFGYIMDLRPEEYKELTEVFVSRDGGGFTSWKAIVEAAIRIVSAFRILHVHGYSYQDMSSGNFFINPKTGAVLICDNDNVAPNGMHTGIIGTPKYMAPEIVASDGEIKPSLHTDEFSLSVVLFYLLCKGHPLEGERWAEPCLTPADEKRLYGTDPLFVFDPKNAANRPVRGFHGKVITLWKCLPQYVKDMFLKAFSQDAITNPNKRVTEMDWLDMLVRFQSDIVHCPSCGNELFVVNTADTPCDKCGKVYHVISTLKLRGYSITAAEGTRIYRCQLAVCNADAALTPAMQVVVAEPDNPRIIELKNMTRDTLTGITPSGKRNLVKPGDIIPVKPGIRVQVFGGEITIQ